VAATDLVVQLRNTGGFLGFQNPVSGERKSHGHSTHVYAGLMLLDLGEHHSPHLETHRGRTLRESLVYPRSAALVRIETHGREASEKEMPKKANHTCPPRAPRRLARHGGNGFEIRSFLLEVFYEFFSFLELYI